MEGKRIVAVDLVRTVAVLLVLAAHLGLADLASPSTLPFLHTVWYKIWVHGAYGVTLFFVVSGYLITRLIATGPGGLFRPDLRDFYVRRVGRIVPLLLVICLYGWAVVSWAGPGSKAVEHCFRGGQWGDETLFLLSIATFWENWYHLFFPVGGLHWGILWSLSIEEQFYFFYPLCLRWLGGARRLFVFLCVFVALGPLSHWIGLTCFEIPGNKPVHFNSFSGFGLIALGGLLFLASERYGPVLARNRVLSGHLAVLGLLIIARVYFKQPYAADLWGRTFDHTVLGIGVSLFLLGALHLDLSRSRFLSILSTPGKWSYGMYLLQGTVVWALWGLLERLNEFAAYFLLAFFTAFIAWLSFRFFEMPVNRFVRRAWGRGGVNRVEGRG